MPSTQPDLPLIGVGRTAELFAWDEGRALKLFFDWMSADSIVHEEQMTRLAQAAGLSVPAVYEHVTLDGRQGFVLDRIDGPTMLADQRARPWTMIRACHLLAQLHATIHAAPGDGLRPVHERLARCIESAAPLTPVMRQTALDALARLPDGDSFCHGDFHPDNVLLAARGPVIIDWTAAMCGHPHADVARTLLLFSVGGVPYEISAAQRWLINRFRAALKSVYLRHYCALTGASPAAIQAWMLPITAARLAEDIRSEQPLVLALVNDLLADR